MQVKKLRFAVVCEDNVNKSICVHRMMRELNLDVRSYGTNNEIILPGETNPVRFPFTTDYSVIYNHLTELNMNFYRNTTVLEMLEKNMEIKKHPELFQNSKLDFDVILILDYNSKLLVLDDLQNRKSQLQNDIQLLYLPLKYDLSLIRDAAQHAAVLCELVQDCDGNSYHIKSYVNVFNETCKSEGYVLSYNVYAYKNLSNRSEDYIPGSIFEQARKKLMTSKMKKSLKQMN